jgi:enoyl-[acyl-carrier protein] reductase II
VPTGVFIKSIDTGEANMKTRVSDLLGIELPIIQGAMAWIANASLAGAVSEAGGLGIIATGAAPLSWIEAEINAARAITSKPIGVNVMLLNPEADKIASLLAKMKVDVITTGAGNPSPYVEMWKEAGIKVIPVVASSVLARRMEKIGADGVIAEGQEAGGHIGELTTMALVPQVCDAVSIPVIAAGGIADGRGMCAAFCLGAEGIQMGTRFLTVKECTISDAYKQKIIAAKDSDTIVTGRRLGHPVRALKNTFARNARIMENDSHVSEADLEKMYAGSLHNAVLGDVDGGSLMAGQIAGLVHERKSARSAMEEVIAEAEALAGLTLTSIAKNNATK